LFFEDRLHLLLQNAEAYLTGLPGPSRGEVPAQSSAWPAFWDWGSAWVSAVDLLTQQIPDLSAAETLGTHL
jgi:hypothetical protein